MAVIKEIITIHGGYSAQVKLKEEFEDRSQNIERMSHYKPIQAHRKAFEIMAEGIFKKDSKRCFILSGSYGTGKSHLCLMAANYLESPSDMPEMQQFFLNYTEAEKEEQVKKADQLKTIRKAGRYLVCICDYGLEASFETIILRALKDALRRESIDIDELDSHYLQAVKKLELWETSHPYFYKEFERRLEQNHPNWTLAKFKKGLSDYSKDAIDIFRKLHKEITTADFDYEKDNLVDIIKQIGNSKAIKDKFRGIAILFDEFDNQMKNKRFDVNVFQKFGEMCENSFISGFVTVFIATIHRSFLSYKNIYNDADFKVASDRMSEIPLETQGIEDIISAIVIPDKTAAGWINEVEPNKNEFNNLAAKCEAQGIFSWLSAPKRRKRIIENIYPMHPMATYSLLRLASDVGSNNRSVFTFFADEKEDSGSYDWFVRNHSIIGPNGGLQLYTVDLLFEYFGSKISTDNGELRPNVKDMVKDFETSQRELNKHRHNKQELDIEHKIYDRVLHTMIIYNIIGMPVNFENLKFGLNINSENGEKELEAYVKNANQLKIIYLNDTNGCYEFRKSDALDISGLIREYKLNSENIPKDVIGELKDEIIKNHDIKGTQRFFKNEEYLQPKEYNATFNEDKRLKRFFVSVKQFEASDFLATIAQLVHKARADYKAGYEAAAVYVICETPDEVRRASTIAMKNTYKTILIGIPTEEIPIFDVVFSLKACVNLNTENFSAQDLGVLKEYVRKYDKLLAEALQRYISSRNIVYYGISGAEITRNNLDNNKASGKVLEDIYETKRNKCKHEDLNVNHEFKEKKNTALREAVESLLNFSEEFGYRAKLAADRGDVRYIEKVLHFQGVITKITVQGDKTLCQLELNTGKYKSLLPALATLIEDVKTSGDGVNIVSLIEKLVIEHGLGFNATILFFAVMIRYFKEGVHIKQDVTEIGSFRPTSYDEILDIVYYKKYKNAMLIYKDISEKDKAFIKMIKPIFISHESSLKDEFSVDELYDAMGAWYKGIPAIAKIKDIYTGESTLTFLEVFQQIDKVNPVEFLLEKIKTIYGYDCDALLQEAQASDIANQLKNDKNVIDTGYDLVRQDIIAQVKTIFGITDITYEAILAKINQWYENLSDVQREVGDYYNLHNDNSKPIIQAIGKGDGLDEVLMVKLPGDKGYNIGAVKDWTTDKRTTYIEKIRLGKQHIEESVFVVDPPDYKVTGTAVKQQEIKIDMIKVLYRKQAKLTISPLQQHEKLYITSNGSNPKDQDVQREVTQESYVFDTSDNKTLKFAAADKEGRYSKIVTVIMENEEKKYEVGFKKPEHTMDPLWGTGSSATVRETDPKVEVTLPKDKESMKRCVLSLFGKSIEKYKIEKDILRQCLDEIKKEL